MTAAKKVTPAKKIAKNVKVNHGSGIGAYARELLRKGKTNQEVLAAVKTKFPDSACSMSNVNWYRNKLRVEGEKVPMARDITKAAKKTAKKAAKTAASADII